MSENAVDPSVDLHTVRDQRVHLRRACHELEVALAAPLTGGHDEWAHRVAPAVLRIREAFASHVSITEGRGGLFDQIRSDAPRLVGALRRLHREHRDIAAKLASAEDQLEVHGEAALERLREQLTALLLGLRRHRQRGADLLYEAYQVDLGGE